MDYWNIEFWNTSDGICRVEKDLLKQMRKTDKFAYKSLEEKMMRYVKSPFENVQNRELEKVKNEKYMWELKFHLPNNNQIRFLGCVVLENDIYTFYALYGFRKKDQKIKEKDRYIAKSRIKEFINQKPKNELQKIL